MKISVLALIAVFADFSHAADDYIRCDAVISVEAPSSSTRHLTVATLNLGKGEASEGRTTTMLDSGKYKNNSYSLGFGWSRNEGMSVAKNESSATLILAQSGKKILEINLASEIENFNRTGASVSAGKILSLGPRESLRIFCSSRNLQSDLLRYLEGTVTEDNKKNLEKFRF